MDLIVRKTRVPKPELTKTLGHDNAEYNALLNFVNYGTKHIYGNPMPHELGHYLDSSMIVSDPIFRKYEYNHEIDPAKWQP